MLMRIQGEIYCQSKSTSIYSTKDKNFKEMIPVLYSSLLKVTFREGVKASNLEHNGKTLLP